MYCPLHIRALFIFILAAPLQTQDGVALIQFNHGSPQVVQNDHDEFPKGSFAGAWESTSFATSGTLSLNLTMSAAANVIEAEVLLSGADITYATLSGTARRVDENIWAVELSSKRPKLHVWGIPSWQLFLG